MADLESQIARGDIAPVYILSVKDVLLAERVVALLRDRTVPEAVRAFNYDVVEPARTSADAILAAATTLPMMAKQRLVLVRELGAMAAADLTRLIPYLEDPAPSTVLVALCAKVDGRTKFFQRAKKLGYLHELAAPKRLEPWLASEVQRQDVRMSSRAQSRLIDVVGGDLARLSLAVSQLAVYAGERAVEVDDVDDLIADTRERSVFELIDAIGARNRERALAAVQSLCDQRQSGIGVVMMLARHVRQLSQLKAAVASGVGKGGLARAVGVPPFVVDKLTVQARRYSSHALATGLETLARADRELKGLGQTVKVLGRPLAERVTLERLAVELIDLAAADR